MGRAWVKVWDRAWSGLRIRHVLGFRVGYEYGLRFGIGYAYGLGFVLGYARDFLPPVLIKLKIHFSHLILQIAKNLSKQATALIFFQRKLRVHTFRIWKRGTKTGPRGEPIVV